MLTDLDYRNSLRDMKDIDHRKEFDRKWNEFTPEEKGAIDAEIKRILDELIANPSPAWGAIMNTSIEGGRVNPFNGIRGDWRGTAWQPIWERHGQSSKQAALFFGTLWKLRIIQRPEHWIGVRNTKDKSTFPKKGVYLAGKTYFLATGSR